MFMFIFDKYIYFFFYKNSCTDYFFSIVRERCTFKQSPHSELFVLVWRLSRHRGNKVIQREVRLLLLENKVHMRIFKQYLLTLFSQLLQLLVHILDPVQAVLKLRVLRNRLKLTRRQSREKLLVVRFQLERVGLCRCRCHWRGLKIMWQVTNCGDV